MDLRSVSGAGIEDQMLKQRMFLLRSHLGNYQGFRSSLLGTRGRGQHTDFPLFHIWCRTLAGHTFM